LATTIFVPLWFAATPADDGPFASPRAALCPRAIVAGFGAPPSMAVVASAHIPPARSKTWTSSSFPPAT
jgi:hypothetical protein